MTYVLRLAKLLLLAYVSFAISGCASTQPSANNQDKVLNFLIHTDSETPEIYGGNESPWIITANRVKEKEQPKIYFYDFDIQSQTNEFYISAIKYKYDEYGKWRPLQTKKFVEQHEGTLFAKKQTLQSVPITIKKTGDAHKQIFHITVKSNQTDEVALALVFGVNKCIAKKENETLCF